MVDLTVDVIKATTQYVAAQAWEEISLAHGFEGHLKNLKEKFNDTQAFLQDVGSANDVAKSERVKRWLQKVKDITYFADNVMDDYDYEILRREIEQGKNLTRKKKVCNFFSCSNNPIVFRFRMTHKVLEIISKFDEVDQEAKRIGLIQRDLDKEALFSYDERTHLEHIRNNSSAELIGRKADKQKLLEMMCSHDDDKEHLSIVAVVGLGDLKSWKDFLRG
ncbi:disease resistance protein RGA2-like isoform X2 [Chenopodium quinoa]|uniref:disease resistance protein RGA2-like isoform X2 n=1 Tax=Chenopodium quinoa TaxID=63459 RepID=UPI000B7865D5|nr:disease resistance protein RGA2-like isoform X2 [Chenopodium quinoa]